MNLLRLARSAAEVFQRHGLAYTLRKARQWISHRISRARFRDYQAWRSDHQRVAKAWHLARGRKVVIVIPSYNDRRVLEPCLESLKSTLPAGKAEIIIVDDKSPENAHREWLGTLAASSSLPLRVIFRDENGGFAKAVNTGLREALGKDIDVILLNSDIEAKPGWLETLQYGAHREEEIGLCGPKLLYPDGSIQSAGTHRNEHDSPYFYHYYRGKPASYALANVPAHCLAMTGACLYIKAPVLAQVGLFDKGFGMGYEDLDYCLRAWQHGFRSYYYPFSELTHHESATRGKKQGPREQASHDYFWKKWGSWFDQRNVRDPSGKTRVIYVMEETGVAGGHRNVFDQLNRLKEAGFSCELWALKNQTDWFELDVPVRTFSSFEELTSALAPVEAIKVATWWRTGKWVWLASVEKGIPAWLVQDIESSYYAGDALRGAEVLSSYRKEFRYFTICNWNVEQLRDLDLKAALQPCGIDLGIYKVVPGTTRRENVLMTSGRANPLKNLPLTLEAWENVKRNQPELWLYGTEPALAEGLSNARYIERPSDADVNRLLNEATAFILSSHHEGFALTILEAMAAGCPVICTDADGNRDFCVDGQNCLMVGKYDAAGLTRSIERLFADPGLQEKLRQEGFKTAQAYDWKNQTRSLVSFFEGLTLRIPATKTGEEWPRPPLVS